VRHEHFLPAQRLAQAHLMHRRFGSVITHRVLRSFSWLASIRFGSIRVKRREALSTDHHLVVCNLRL